MGGRESLMNLFFKRGRPWFLRCAHCRINFWDAGQRPVTAVPFGFWAPPPKTGAQI